MKSATTGAVSGCIVWLLVFMVIGACLMPIGFMIGGFTSGMPFAARTVSPIVCPKGTTGQIYSYETTTTDDNGFSVPATAYELHCVDANDNVVKNDPVVFAFIWEGIAAATAALLTALLAFLLAAPAGVLIGRLFKPRQTPAA